VLSFVVAVLFRSLKIVVPFFVSSRANEYLPLKIEPMKQVFILLLAGLCLGSCGSSKPGDGSAQNLERTLDDKNAAVLPLKTRIQRLPGVTLQAGVPVFIKNNNSTRGARPPEPLYVVDGQVIGNSYRTVESVVQPVDVDTIKALSGSEASFYGTQGANGVILITTKRGN
jgi:TonB-dependent SusC/RagA subfamily outer membrane receptor